MKEFLKSKKVTYNLMSFTGFKALVLFSLLLETPRSYAEICDYFLNHPYLREKISLDTLRVYLTSLKRVGCEVKRERVDGISKYGIVSNPFELSIPDVQLKSLIKVYKMMSKELTVEELLHIELFIKNLSSMVKNPDVIEYFSKVSLLKGINLDILKDLISICAKKEQIVFLYKSPRSGNKEIEIVASHLKVDNNKVYLFGFSREYKHESYYLLNRILKIQEIKFRKEKDFNMTEITVGFEYSGEKELLDLKTNEKIVSESNNKTIIEITTSNEFIIYQRLLGLTDKAKVLYPESFKKDFIFKLKKMRAGYYIG